MYYPNAHILSMSGVASLGPAVYTAAFPDLREVLTEIKTHHVKAVSFSLIGDLTEDCSQGDSLSDSSEELL